jgi:hypothetical protein
LEVINPSTEEVITSVHEATEKDVDIAVAAARRAFEGSWRKVTPQDRGKLLVTLSSLIERNSIVLSSIEALDNGKAFEIAKGDVAAVADCLRYYGGWADKIEGKVIDTHPDVFSYTRQEPVSPRPHFLPKSLLFLPCPLSNILDWCLWSNNSMELSLTHAGMETRPSARDRKHYCIEDCRADTPLCSCSRDPDQRGWFPTWSC